MPSAMGVGSPQVQATVDLVYTNPGLGDPPPTHYETQVREGSLTWTMEVSGYNWKSGAALTSAVATWVAQLDAAEGGFGVGWNPKVRDAGAVNVVRTSDSLLTCTADAPTYDIIGPTEDENILLTEVGGLIDGYDGYQETVGDAALSPVYNKLLPTDIPTNLRIPGDYHFTVDNVEAPAVTGYYMLI